MNVIIGSSVGSNACRIMISKSFGKKFKKFVLNAISLVFCIGITLIYVFHNEDIDEIKSYIKDANWFFWIIGAVFVLIFILGESVIFKYLLSALGYRESLWNCSLYSFVGFFFSCVTPSASGGQPMQAWFMKRNGVPVHSSTLALLIVTINYKAVLLIYGFGLIIFKPAGIYGMLSDAMPWIYLGLALNVVVVLLMITLAIKPKVTETIVMWIFGSLSKIFKKRKFYIIEKKAEKAMKDYAVRSKNLMKHKALMARVLGITFLQRTVLFFVTYLVIVSFGYTGIGPLTTTWLQGLISLAVDMLPLPGGMGVSEYIFNLIFRPVLGSGLTTPALIVSRGLAYYTQLIISAIMTVVAYIVIFGWRQKR